MALVRRAVSRQRAGLQQLAALRRPVVLRWAAVQRQPVVLRRPAALRQRAVLRQRAAQVRTGGPPVRRLAPHSMNVSVGTALLDTRGSRLGFPREPTRPFPLQPNFCFPLAANRTHRPVLPSSRPSTAGEESVDNERASSSNSQMEDSGSWDLVSRMARAAFGPSLSRGRTLVSVRSREPRSTSPLHECRFPGHQLNGRWSPVELTIATRSMPRQVRSATDDTPSCR